MKTSTKQEIFEIISKNYPIWATQIANIIWFSNEITHRHLKKLLQENKIYKSWTPPKVFYFPLDEKKENNVIFEEKDESFLKENFLDFTPDWRLLYWKEAFINWCEKRQIEPKKELEIYKNTLQKYKIFEWENWFIDWKKKMQETFEHIYLDEIYYIDFYSIEKYWKTLLWNLMFYWKQTADKEIISKILEIITNPILNFISEKNIDSFAFIPPSIDRKVQLLTQIKKWLNLDLKELKLLKIFKDKIVSQKSLSKKSDRIENARKTIFIENQNFSWKKILLIDDAVWSGATLNETAKKIKEKNISSYVIWIAIVGSFKWFEVINEV